MTKLLHLTDLHFGAERKELILPLAQAIRACAPDAVVVSGDLTHRARPAQFHAAMAFLADLGLPFLTVPGNHDIPLWNIGLRFGAPFRRYDRGTAAPQAGPMQIGATGTRGMRLFTANTADPFRIRSGVMRARDVARVERELLAARTEGEALNLLVCHHPIEEPPGFDRGETRHAPEGMARLLRAGLHGVLTGHLHHWAIGLGITATSTRPLLQIQSGTALCARPGEKDHGFALLEQTKAGLTVTPWMVSEEDRHYHPRPAQAFHHGADGWSRL